MRGRRTMPNRISRDMSRLATMAERLVALPPPGNAARRMIEHSFIDILGCVLSGNRHPEAGRLHHVARDLGSGSAAVYGTRLRLAAPQAAFVNATASHLEEFDDWEEPGNTHPSAVIWPAIWALASLRPIGGGTALTAYAAGFEAITRLGEALNFDHYNRGWHSTATLGIVGAAVACGHVLGFDRHRLAAAIGLALTQGSGYAAQFGSVVKPMQAGFASRDGLSSALMAEAGLEGQDAILDGPRGFAALLAGTDMGRLDDAIDAIDGSALDRWGVITKLYPTCSYTHRLADCAVALHHRIAPAGIAAIEAELPDFHYAILAYDRPQSAMQARFSLPFVIATCLVHGDLQLTHLEDPAGDRKVWDCLERVQVIPTTPRRPLMNYDPDQPDSLRVTLSTGEVVEERRAYPTGSLQAPASRERILAKFASLAAPIGVHPGLEGWATAGDLATCLQEVTQ